MPKIYMIVVEKGEKPLEVMLDLKHLPPMPEVSGLWEVGDDVVRWLQSDLPRASRLVKKLAAQDYDQETRDFLANLMSLWDAAFSPFEKKDALFCAMPGRGGFIRSSPDGVASMLEATRNGLNPFE